MKKVLILAYDFPPYVSVGGQRPYSWFCHLKEFEIEPIIFTRNWEGSKGDEYDFVRPSLTKEKVQLQTEFGTLNKAPFKPHFGHRLYWKYGPKRYKFLRKVYTGIVEMAQFHLPMGPKREIYLSARDYLAKNKVDAIIATGEPFVLFHYGNKLAKEFNTPWVADYRDPWSTSFQLKNSILKTYYRYIEQKIISSAAYIQTVGEFVGLGIKALHPNKKVHVVKNGFDATHYDLPLPKQNAETLTFSYVGTIYNWYPLKTLIQAFSTFAANGNNFKLQFIGIGKEEEIWCCEDAIHPNLRDKIVILPKMPNNKLAVELAKSNILLLFNNYDISGTKIYDYLAAKRLILMGFTDSTEAKVLKEKFYFEKAAETGFNPQMEILNYTKSGITVADKHELVDQLVRLEKEFFIHKEIKIDSVHIEEFSRQYQVQKMAEILKKEIFAIFNFIP